MAGFIFLSACTPTTKWKDLAGWSHSWDANDPGLTTYSDDGTSFSLPPATRVSSVPDPSGGRAMQKDSGVYDAGFGLPPAPGPIWVPSSSRFVGRNAWYSDVILVVQAYFDNLHSMMSPILNPNDPSQAFNLPQPWWGAILARTVPGATGNEVVFIDGNPGMTTMGATPQINISTWNSSISTGPFIRNPAPITSDQTAFVMWQVNGASSWLEVNTRDSSGVLTTTKTAGAQGTANPLTSLHSGWTHTNYTSALGITAGVASTDQLNTVRNWGTAFIPNAGALA